jgi:hypothetical protein
LAALTTNSQTGDFAMCKKVWFDFDLGALAVIIVGTLGISVLALNF